MRDIDKTNSWYVRNQSLYESLAEKVADILKENIEEANVPHHSITHRGKSTGSFIAKAQNEKYTDPPNQIKDMAGIRVITYLESDVSRIAKIIESLFDIDWSDSRDQAQLLGSDKVGYRSVHYVAVFGRNRCGLPEYKRYENLPFEIQVRSLLQHAWAEIEHDRNYKFRGKLPAELERRFFLVAGMLEIADREFVALANAIEEYQTEMKRDLKRGDLDIEVTTASLTEYLSNRFSRLTKSIPEGGRMGKTIVEELELFGIRTLDQLDTIIPEDFENRYLALIPAPMSFLGVVRDILMIKDIEKYFGVSWRNSWQVLESSGLKILAEYDVDVGYLDRYQIEIRSDF